MEMKNLKTYILEKSPILFVIAVWEILGWFNNTPLLPPFSKVIVEFYNMLINGVLIKNLFYSFYRVVSGYIMGAITGITVGILMGVSKPIERSLSPLISLLLPIPTLGWLPLMMLWIGINEMLPITLIFICAFFPVAYATLHGIKEIPKEYIYTAKALGASRSRILFKILIPMALPSIFTGLRLEAGMVWKTVLASEMFAISTGIGAIMISAESLIRVDIIMVSLVVIGIMSFSFEKFVLLLEKITVGRWR